MSSYAPFHSMPYVCFQCRKSWKLASNTKSEKLRHCPQCQDELIFMGRYFKAPSMSDMKQWRKVELLYKRGWVAGGCYGAPKTLREVTAYFQTREDNQLAWRRYLKRQENDKQWRRARRRRVNDS